MRTWSQTPPPTLDATGRQGVILTLTKLRHLGNLQAIVIDMLVAGAKNGADPHPAPRQSARTLILVVAAYESKAECDTAERRFEQRAKERGIALTDKTGLGMSYDCFPDTVDPRGPKGK